MKLVIPKPSILKRDLVGTPQAWAGGTTTYRNHSLYRSHDLYRGGTDVSTDIWQTERKPNIQAFLDIKPG